MLTLLLAGCTGGATDVSRVVSSGVPGTVTVAHETIRNADVDVLAISDGYVAPVDAQKALTLALAQLGPSIHPSSAHLYLGRFMTRGTESILFRAGREVIDVDPAVR